MGHHERAGDSLTPICEHASQGVEPATSEGRPDTVCGGTWKSTRPSPTRSTEYSPTWSTHCAGTSLRRPVYSGGRSAISHLESARAGWPRIVSVRSASTSSMSWPSWSRTVAWSGYRPRRGTRESSTSARPAGENTNIEARYEGDISGFLRLLTVVVATGIVRWVLSQDFRRLDQRLEREATAASRWQRGYHPDLALEDGFVAMAVDRADDVTSS